MSKQTKILYWLAQGKTVKETAALVESSEGYVRTVRSPNYKQYKQRVRISRGTCKPGQEALVEGFDD